MWWSAAQTSDYYDVFGFLENVNTGAVQTLFHETGDSTPWTALNTTISSDVCSSGVCDLRFKFLNGTYDQTCGRAIGSYLYIDGINVNVTGVATDSILETILENVQYQNTSDNPPASRYNTISHNDGTGSASSGATIHITAVNDAPHDISLSNSLVGENQPAGSLVGTLTSSDVDSSSFTYRVLNSVPFAADGNRLETTAVLDYEGAASYNVQIETDDGAGGTFSEWF